MADRVEPGLECVTKGRDAFGEGPRWSVRDRRLYWIDVTAKLLKSYDPSTGAATCVELAYPVTTFAFTASGGWLMNYMRGPRLWSPEHGDGHRFATDGVSAAERFNDGRCDSRGRFWTGTYPDGLKGADGRLYCVLPDGRLHPKDDGIRLSNGLAWNPEETRLYYCDTSAGHVYRYDFDIDDGHLGERVVHLDFNGGHGHPDGCVMDAEGGLWIAHPNHWRVCRYTPDGRLDREVRLPVQKPLSVTFGGDDLKTLYITSRRYGLSPAELDGQPLAGGLFALWLPVGGLAEHAFDDSRVAASSPDAGAYASPQRGSA